MHQGTVSCYDKRAGYGFITPDDGGAEVLVSFRELVRAGIEPLQRGQRVQFYLPGTTQVRIAIELTMLYP